MSQPTGNFRIAIDGPAGSGKSSVSKLLAQRLGFDHLDTGAMYRAIALLFLERRLNPDELEDDELEKLLEKIEFEFRNGRLLFNGREIGEEIRTPEVGAIVSKVARLRKVREKLVDEQRRITRSGRFVVEGRDIGTVVLPDAELKIFLTASPEERAMRRYRELRNKGMNVSFEEVLNEIKMRDRLDSGRDIAPLKPAEDAIILNTDNMSLEEVVLKIEKLAREKMET